jgi:3-phenylpropionate/trans-cinnamate dioxygenase ferredoxin subunit
MAGVTHMTSTKSAKSLKPSRNDGYVAVASMGDVPPGASKLVEIDDLRVALFNVNGIIYAIEDVCTHDGGPLVEGTLVHEHEVECPRHGAHFDVRTGAALSFPAFRPTETFAVRIEGDTVLIAVPD